MRIALLANSVAAMIAFACALGCRSPHANYQTVSRPVSYAESYQELRKETELLTSVSVQQASYAAQVIDDSALPPNIEDYDRQAIWELTLDQAVSIAMESSQIIRDHGGKVLTYPNIVKSTLDPALLRSDPNIGKDAALSAFDTQFETGLFWNGGGSPVNSAFNTGQFGVFAQPETLAKAGLGRVLKSGTKVSVGSIGGYDEQLAGGFYAAYGAELRHPLMRRGGREFNDIAGPFSKLGMYHGIRISEIDHQQAQLEVEQAIIELVRDISVAYWELYFAYQNLNAKRYALDNARKIWERERDRAATGVSPKDVEALARQQFMLADAEVQNAISGTGRGQTGVLSVEAKLRSLMAVPASSDQRIYPIDPPLDIPFVFDWNESHPLAYNNRIELRKQRVAIDKRMLELKAAKNLQRPQMDVVAQYRRLADDPSSGTQLFSQALQGWQLGLDYARPVANRRENAAVQNAKLQLSREHAIAEEQRRHISSELRTAFIELQRAFRVMNLMVQARDASRERFEAQSKRHEAGDTRLEDVLEAHVRATKAETEFQRSVVDYNLAFVKLHMARGTLLHVWGIGFGNTPIDSCPMVLNAPSIFSSTQQQPDLPAQMVNTVDGQIPASLE